MNWNRTILIALEGEIMTNINGEDVTVPNYQVVGTHETRYAGPTAAELELAVIDLINVGTVSDEEVGRVVFLQKLDSEIEVSRAVSVKATVLAVEERAEDD